MLTDEQIKEYRTKYKVSPVDPYGEATDTLSGDALREKLGLNKEVVEKKETVRLSPRARATAGTIVETTKDIIQTGKSLKESLKKRQEKVQEGRKSFESGEQSLLETGFQLAGQTAGLLSDSLFDLTKGAIKALIPDATEDKIRKISDKAGEVIAKTPGLKTIFEKYEELKKTNPRKARNLDATMGLSQLALDLAGVDLGARAAVPTMKATESALETVGRGIGKATQIPNDVASALGKQVEKSIPKAVDELVGSTKSMTRKVKDIEQLKNTDVRRKLSDPEIFKGIKVEGGKINPDEAINTLQERVNILTDAKNKTLPEIEKNLPTIKKESIRKDALSDISGKYSPRDEQDLVKAIDDQLSAMPDEITITQADNFRARFRKSARDARGIQKRSSEYSALENAFRKNVFDSTESLGGTIGKEYASLNTEIKDLLNTIDFLENSVRGQTVKGGRLRRYVLQGIGAVAGSSNIFTTVLGAEAGGIIADIITSNQLGSSMKMKLIKNITSNEEVLKQAESLIKKVEDYTPLMLPESSDNIRRQFGTGKTINLPAKSTSTLEAEEIQRLTK